MSETPVEATAPQVAEEPVEEVETDAPEAEAEKTEDDWRKDFDPEKAGARIRKLQNEAKNLRERAKSAEEKAAGVTEKDSRIGELESTVLRYEVGYELGLPAPLVDRLKGSTRDELIDDAKSLLDLVGTPKASPGSKPMEALRGGGRPDAAPEETDVDKLGARMFSH